MRVLISESPFTRRGMPVVSLFNTGAWPAHWVACTGADKPPFVTAYRREFSLDENTKIRIHVSADERYELFLDGRRIGRGPERGAPRCWFFETYDLDLEKGQHLLVARVWALGDLAPLAQLSVRPGFLLAAEGVYNELLGTGVAPWEAKVLGGYSFVGAGLAFGTGAKETIDGSKFPWGFERGDGGGWEPVTVLETAQENETAIQFRPQHLMAPAMLLPMMEEERLGRIVRHVSAPATADTASTAVRRTDNVEREREQWDDPERLKPVEVPAHSIRRVIFDLDNYYCAYPRIMTSQGKGSAIRMTWLESLFESPKVNIQGSWWEKMPKGNRDEVEGKFVLGVADTFLPDGEKSREFDTLWWRPGRYIELLVETADEPLIIERFSIFETRYPLEMESSFECSDERIARLTPIVLRGLQECSHETNMDCCGHEQHLYTPDTRLAALTSYAIANDDRLARKALRLHDLSRNSNGLTRACYPSRISMVIPSYSLFWVAMVYDFAWWRDDRRYVRHLMPGVRAVLDAVLEMENEEGLIDTSAYWNWFDWVPNWPDAVPLASRGKVSGLVNWQFIWTLRMVSELEGYVGEPEMAARVQRLAEEFTERTVEVWWEEQRGLFADGPDRTGFYEHTQCLALMSGMLSPEMRKKTARALFSHPDLTRTTIYTAAYLFEVCALFDRMDVFFDRMGLWFDLEKEGLKAAYEMPEISTRADCFGWGGYPLYHYFATILGIRPGSPGFQTVRIAPHLGRLQWAKGSMIHAKGKIETDFRSEDGVLHGSIVLPKGLTGRFEWNGKTWPLLEGRNVIR